MTDVKANLKTGPEDDMDVKESENVSDGISELLDAALNAVDMKASEFPSLTFSDSLTSILSSGPVLRFAFTSVIILQVSEFQNVLMKNQFHPKYQRKNFRDFCPSL